MRNTIIFWVTILAALVAAVPVAAIATFLLAPLWSWFEARTGIESIGHSGPADWCFLVVYSLIVIVAIALLWRLRGRQPQGH